MTTTTDQTPVFVDPSGRRRRVLRILIGVAVAGVLVYVALLVVALSGGPVKPSSLLPLPAAEDVPTTTTSAPPTTTAETTTETTTARDTTERTTTEGSPTVTTTAEPTTPSTPGSRRTDPPGASNRPTPPGKG
ncbi:hypothetical protein [Saccharothrix variisporea]|uniref:Uncharacterized protein n=1 Tax=Saccharothrix variisporea TaxID=543527 RepID=A0A495XII0_9PSEU|nr:hypothetical protein [Saccharothrix variisporea]RKT72313.1 hypothetical protein DFJ66_5623 [Saccharothrix variisporea]